MCRLELLQIDFYNIKDLRISFKDFLSKFVSKSLYAELLKQFNTSLGIRILRQLNQAVTSVKGVYTEPFLNFE